MGKGIAPEDTHLMIKNSSRGGQKILSVIKIYWREELQKYVKSIVLQCLLIY